MVYTTKTRYSEPYASGRGEKCRPKDALVEKKGKIPKNKKIPRKKPEIGEKKRGWLTGRGEKVRQQALPASFREGKTTGLGLAYSERRKRDRRETRGEKPVDKQEKKRDVTKRGR